MRTTSATLSRRGTPLLMLTAALLVGISVVMSGCGALAGDAIPANNTATTSTGASPGSPDETVVATVDGDPVIAAELAHFAGMRRAALIDAYASAYGAEYDEFFWNRSYAGQTPLQTLREQALKDAVRMKVELRQAYQHDIIESALYTDLLALMAQENKRREAAVAKGEPIYGPVRFEADGFIDFYRSKIRTTLREELAREELAPTEAELRAYYEQEVPDLMPVEDRIVYDLYTVSYRESGEPGKSEDGSEQERRDAALRTAEAIRTQLEEGIGQEGAHKATSDGAAELERTQAEADLIGTPDPVALPDSSPAPSVVYEPGLVLDERSASRMFRSAHALYTALRESAVRGGAPQVVDDASEGRYVVVHIQSREAGNRPDFEEVRDQVRKLHLEAAYERYIDDHANNARVERLPALEQLKLGVL
ncbi:hypothetical protein PA598K_02338 [Paenibacillus sp. 598K]|uniref:hypothetical protein n=1 Tax=Paenibacillus sp. 598K TaxID=1117987 RepID=UPI000FFA3A5A|nr:hypothetical protein [Paenibacillus sp. 598K]GBF74009.1 hypothetical protein PA598K_02338 [Paenibacillus sp. 598K]